jgi:hypothetical protein
MCVVRCDWIGRSFGWNRKNRGLVSQQVWHDNDHPCSKVLRAEHKLTFCSPPPEMVTSPYKWKILEPGVKQYIINLYRRIMSEKDRRTLQQDRDTLQKCEDVWLMQLHSDKCKVLQITTRRTPLQSRYTIHGQVLNNANSAKYLGLNIHRTLS